MTAVLYIRVPDSLKATIDEIAAETNLTLTQVVVELLERSVGSGRGMTVTERIDKALWDRSR